MTKTLAIALTMLLVIITGPATAQTCIPPANEDCDGATSFTFAELPLSVSAILGCTNDMVDRPYFDVFYRYDCTVSGDYSFDMCGSLGDTYMRIYIDGCGFGPASTWVEDDDSCRGSPNSIDPQITITLDAGTSYWIELGSWRVDDFFPPNANDPYEFHVEFLDGGSWTDLGGGIEGSNGTPNLVGTGPLLAGFDMSLDLTGAPSGAPVLLWLSLSSTPLAYFGGTVHAFPPTTAFLLSANGSGELSIGGTWPAGVPGGTELWFQYLVDEPSVFWGITLSNGVLATTP